MLKAWEISTLNFLSEDYVSKLIKTEEERFSATLADGEKHLEEALKASNTKVLTGEVAFKLYDTYGFPVELTEEIALESGYTVDMDGFKEHMEAQKERAREARKSVDSMSSQSQALLEFTEESEFIGYEHLESTSKIIGLFVNGETVKETTENFSLITDVTPFYAESGGQAGDTGVLVLSDGSELTVIDTIKAPNKQHLHLVENDSRIKVGDTITLKVDEVKREHTKRNHSSIHLVHAALISILGDHVAQAGSFVNDKYARLDFSHFEKVSTEQIETLELMVNKMIDSARAVEVEFMGIEEAKASGAMALFDEKYGDVVRVVTMGEHSKELCGGTHVHNIAEIGIFKVLSEESVGSGVRRLTFTTSQNVYDEMRGLETQLNLIQDEVAVKQSNQILTKISDILEENENLKKELEALAEMKLDQEVKVLKEKVEVTVDMQVMSAIYDNLSADNLKYIADNLRNSVKNALIILATTQNDKVVFVVACDKALNSLGIHAGNIAKELAVATGGNGGGRPDFAQSGGKDTSNVSNTIVSIVQNL